MDRPNARQKFAGLLMLLSLSACDKKPAVAPTAELPPHVAVVAGRPISQDLYDYYVRSMGGATGRSLSPEAKRALLVKLEQLEAAAIVGEKAATVEVTQKLELQRLETLAHFAATEHGVFAEPSEAQLRQAYDDWRATLPASEFHVAHILTATESAASVVINRLRAGQDFGKIAQEQSADDSKTRGGDLGWIAPGRLPEEFMAAVQALKVGGFTSKPIHTRYGWHVIKLLEKRAGFASPFESVKAQLAQSLQQSAYQSFLEDSLKTAN
jgi:peptidyl-prolyl cis-trans isomerase C